MNETKLKREKECPIDNKIYDVILPTVSCWKKLNVTPNFLTFLGFLCTLAFGYYYYYNSNLVFVFLLLRLYFDYIDGVYARKYKMTSKFGDYFDHFNDLLFFVLFFCITQSKLKKNKLLINGIILLFSFLFLVHMGCQEKDVNNNDSETLNTLQKICFNKDWIYITRYFGNGTLYVVMIGVIYYLIKNN